MEVSVPKNSLRLSQSPVILKSTIRTSSNPYNSGSPDCSQSGISQVQAMPFLIETLDRVDRVLIDQTRYALHRQNSLRKRYHNVLVFPKGLVLCEAFLV